MLDEWFFFLLVLTYSLIFVPRCQRFLMTSKFSCPILCVCLGFGGVGSQDLAWPLVKLKSSSKVIGKNMEPRGERTVYVCWMVFKEYKWVADSVLPGVPRTNLG